MKNKQFFCDDCQKKFELQLGELNLEDACDKCKNKLLQAILRDGDAQ